MEHSATRKMEHDISGKMDEREDLIHPREETRPEPKTENEEAHQEEDSVAKPKSYENSVELKTLGNAKFAKGEFATALEDYTSAIDACPEGPDYNKHKSVLHSNRAATFLKLEIKENYETAVADCSTAIELDRDNTKALIRRAQLYTRLDNLDDALVDYKLLMERDPGLPGVKDACSRLPGQIEERNEKTKAEMIDKLKDLGNMVLKPFGLSTDNFKMEPQASGGYSVKFEPSKKK